MRWTLLSRRAKWIWMANEIQMRVRRVVRHRLHRHRESIGENLQKMNLKLFNVCFFFGFCYSFIHKVIDGITIVVNTVNVKFHSPAFTSSVQVSAHNPLLSRYISLATPYLSRCRASVSNRNRPNGCRPICVWPVSRTRFTATCSYSKNSPGKRCASRPVPRRIARSRHCGCSPIRRGVASRSKRSCPTAAFCRRVSCSFWTICCGCWPTRS